MPPNDELYGRQRDHAIAENQREQERMREERDQKKRELIDKLNDLRQKKRETRGEARKKIQDEIDEIERQLKPYFS